MIDHPDLDALDDRLTAMRTRPDYDSMAWHRNARTIYLDLNPIVDQRDHLLAVIEPAWNWLEENKAHPAYAEREEKWLRINDRLLAITTLLDRAGRTLCGTPTKWAAVDWSKPGSSMTTPSSPATTSPSNAPSTSGTGTSEPGGSLITRVRQVQRDSRNDALSASA